MEERVWTVYLCKGRVLVPTKAQTEAGYYMEVEPVERAEANDEVAVAAGLERAMRRGNHRVPTPSRGDKTYRPVVLAPASVRSWAAFERSALAWTVEERQGLYRLIPLRRSAPRGWEEDEARASTLPRGATLEDAARWVASALAQAARTA